MNSKHRWVMALTSTVLKDCQTTQINQGCGVMCCIGLMREKQMEQTDWYQITLDVDVNRRNMNLVVARQVIRAHGESAHMFALEQMLKEGNFEQQRDWRMVLDIIDEINKGESKC